MYHVEFVFCAFQNRQVSNHLVTFFKDKRLVTKKIFFLVSVSSFVVCFFALKPVLAVSLKLTPEQVQEAIEYGQKNKNMDIAAFSKLWTVCLEKGHGSATLFTPYLNVAYKAKKSAVERKEFTNKDIAQALEIGDSLTFTATVYGDEYDFSMYYTAKIYQKDAVIQPEFEFAPEIADASEFWPNPPSHSARLVFKFPVKHIDLESLITFVVVAPGGEETPYAFDLSKLK